MCESDLRTMTDVEALPDIQALPDINHINQMNFDEFIMATSSVQINGTELESFLETHVDEIDGYLTDLQAFSVVKLRESLTATQLTSIPFPYIGRTHRARQTELINWLKRHRSLQTNNIDLLRQRVTNYFKIKVQDIAFLKQENISSIVGRKFDQIKESFNNHKE